MTKQDKKQNTYHDLTGWLILVSVMAATVYEALLAYEMYFYFGDINFWLFMAVGLALAAAWWGIHRVRDITGSPGHARLLYSIFWLHILGAAGLYLMNLAHGLTSMIIIQRGFAVGITLFLILCGYLAMSIGYLLGCSLSLLKQLRSQAGQLQVAAMLGILLGGLTVAGLTPRVDPFGQTVLIAGGNLLLVLFLARRLSLPVHKRDLGLMFLAFLFLLAGLWKHPQMRQIFLQAYYYGFSNIPQSFSSQEPADRLPRVERFFSGYDRLDLVRVPPDMLSEEWPLVRAYTHKYDRQPDFPRGYMLFFNGRFIFRSDYEEIHHEYLVHVPVIMNQKIPGRVLILDLGAGMVARELLKYESIEQIVQVSCSRTLARLAQEHPLLLYLNGRALNDQRLKLVEADPYDFLINDQQSYDAIYIDLPVPDSYRFNRFYTREFFRLVRQHLTPEGYMAFQAPGTGHFEYFDESGNQAWSPQNKWPVYQHTLRSAGFETLLPYVSNLERNQQQAIDGLMQLMLDSEVDLDHPDVTRVLSKERANAVFVDQSVKEYIYALQEGFIMATCRPLPLKNRYPAPDIKLDVLDSRRFVSAFAFDFPSWARINPGWINSLVHPSFPGFWWDL